MKKSLSLLSLITCFMIGIVSNSFAYQIPEKSKAYQSTKKWEIGSELSHICYKEPGVMKEQGTMYGISGSYTSHNTLMFKGEAKFSFGKLDYSSDESGTLQNIDDYIIEFRNLLGYDFSFPGSNINILLTPYFGFGFRYLNDNSGGRRTSIGHWGYEREQIYYYNPIGIELFLKKNNVLSLKAILEYDLLLKGQNITHLSDVNIYNSDLSFDQYDGYGFRHSLKIKIETKKIHYLIEPFIKYWNIQNSEVNYNMEYENGETVIKTYWEPKNNSTEIGIKLGMQF